MVIWVEGNIAEVFGGWNFHKELREKCASLFLPHIISILISRSDGGVVRINAALGVWLNHVLVIHH
jgi:hypothetical protein